MLLRNVALLSIFLVSLGGASTVRAEDAPAEASAETPVDPAKAEAAALTDKVGDVMGNLTQGEVNHFAVLYTNYTIYSMVKAVREDVSQAVNGCAENNKDMADALHKRFEQWDESVGGTMKSSYEGIQNLALAQTYISQSELKGIFASVDKTRAVGSSSFETTPVTTPEACEFMMSKMDETQDSMNHMLKTTLISYPNILQKTQE